MAQKLQIKNLQSWVDDNHILKGVSLEVKPGEIHAVVGPNGSGKSTMAHVLVGHPRYELKDKKSKIFLNNLDLTSMSPDERSEAGLFLAFQYPVEVPGVKVLNFLWAAYKNINKNSKSFQKSNKNSKKITSIVKFRDYLHELAEKLEINKDLISRNLNEGFSGGEKKRLEILQMAVLGPKFAILDETDSGLDVDAIKSVAKSIKKVVKKHNTGILAITHYKRILDYLNPDFVHIMVDGEIVKSGDFSLMGDIEKDGYKDFQN